MNNIKSLETLLSELSDEKKKRIESVANIQAIADELQFLVQQEVEEKNASAHLMITQCCTSDR